MGDVLVGVRKKSIMQELLRSKKDVFSFKELVLLWGDTDLQNIRSRVSYYVRKGYLYHIRRGLYAKDKDYDRFEVATKIFTPAYISFETVLRNSGMIFQYYTSIYVASYRTETVKCDGQEYVFRTIKPTLLTNTLGVTIKDMYSIASPERAFLDMLYIHKDYYFDNLGPLNWDKVYEILPIYGGNKRMEKVVAEQHERFKKEE